MKVLARSTTPAAIVKSEAVFLRFEGLREKPAGDRWVVAASALIVDIVGLPWFLCGGPGPLRQGPLGIGRVEGPGPVVTHVTITGLSTL
jgi:hypothetical protein